MNEPTCPECHLNAMKQSLITMSYPQDGITLRIIDVPALVCAHCGKHLITGDVAHQLSDLLQQVERNATLQHLSQDVYQLRAQVAQVRSAQVELAYA